MNKDKNQAQMILKMMEYRAKVKKFTDKKIKLEKESDKILDKIAKAHKKVIKLYDEFQKFTSSKEFVSAFGNVMSFEDFVKNATKKDSTHFCSKTKDFEKTINSHGGAKKIILTNDQQKQLKNILKFHIKNNKQYIDYLKKHEPTVFQIMKQNKIFEKNIMENKDDTKN